MSGAFQLPSIPAVDRFSLLDTLEQPPRDSTSTHATEPCQTRSYRAAKGKARARDAYEDGFDFSSHTAGSPSHATMNAAESKLDFESFTSEEAPQSDKKGKGRQRTSDVDSPLCLDYSGPRPDDLANMSKNGSLSRFRRPNIGGSSQEIEPEYSSPLSSSQYDDSSLKRSIRELGSSPTNSPQTQRKSLPDPSLSSSASSTRSYVSNQNQGGPSSSSLLASSGIPPSRPGTANKKRRSAGVGDTETNSQAPTSHQADEAPSTCATSSSAPYISFNFDFDCAESPHPVPNQPPSRQDSLYSTRSNSRRASLLFNSSTSVASGSRSTHRNDSLSSASPELSEGQSRSRAPPRGPSEYEIRSALIERARAQIPSGDVHRRRGLDQLESQLTRAEQLGRLELPSYPPTGVPSPSNSDIAFNRSAIDRNPDRPPRGSRFDIYSLDDTGSAAQREAGQRSTAPQPSAPQLPQVRAASPLAVPFADAATLSRSDFYQIRMEELRREEADQRWRAIAQQSEPPQQQGRHHVNLPLPSRRMNDSPPTLPPTRSQNSDSERSLGQTRSAIQANSSESSLRRADVSRGRDTGSGRPQEASTLVPPERMDSWRRFTAQVPTRLRRLETEDAVGTFEAEVTQRFLAQENVRASWRRSRATAEADAHSIPRHDPVTSSQTSAGQREQPPWRREHFGLRTPTNLPEVRAAAYAAARQARSDSLPRYRGSNGWSSSRQERHEDESALEYLGRLMSHDSMLDHLMASDAAMDYPSSSGSVAFDSRNFVRDEDWAELNSYESLMQLGERIGKAEVGVPKSLVDGLPTCQYAKWDGGSCAPRPAVSEGKGKEKLVPKAARDTMCPICREDYLDSDLVCTIPRCDHAFHSVCIKVSNPLRTKIRSEQDTDIFVCWVEKTWFKTAKTCPLCRGDAFDEITLPKLNFQEPSGSNYRLSFMTGLDSSWSFNL